MVINKKILKSFLKILAIVIVVCTLQTSCFKKLTKIELAYSNDFESDSISKALTISGFVGNNFTNNIKQPIALYNGSRVLGFCNSNVIELNLDSLPDHYALKISFDLYIHDIWRNDLWKMVVDGNILLMTGFSNDPAIKQSYPNWIGNGSVLSPSGANAYTKLLPNACLQASVNLGTAEYKIEQTLQHNSKTFQLILSDAGQFFNQPCQRSWSIDNLKIELINN